MDIKAEIKWIQDELNAVDDPLLLETFRDLLLFWKNSKYSEYDDLELYNREIEEALDDIEKGQVYSHEEVKKMIEEWQG